MHLLTFEVRLHCTCKFLRVNAQKFQTEVFDKRTAFAPRSKDQQNHVIDR